MAPQPDARSREEMRSRTLALDLADFSARAGHDLVGPLNQASSLLALFIHRQKSAADAASGSTDANLLLDFLQTSAAKMQSVIAGIQPFLNIAAASPGLEPADLNASLAAARQRLERAIAESRAEIVYQGELPFANANGEQMSTLFEVLIGNAIKFRRPEEAPCIRISWRQAGDDWLFEVADNGIGIAPEYREVVFLPFRRLHGKEYPGAGMGLATAKLIVGLHGGDIRIEEAGENGTAVVFTVPALAPAPALHLDDGR